MSSGKWPFSARFHSSGSRFLSHEKPAACANAWTPESVRPLPVIRIGCPAIFWIAFSIVAWIVGPLAWICQPQ